MKHLHRNALRLAAALALVCACLGAGTARAQDGITIENTNVVVKFGEVISIEATIRASSAIQQASLLFRGANETATRVESLQVAPDGSISFTYDAARNLIPPFTRVVFWFQATLADGRTYTSEPASFDYNDSRFPWRAQTGANVTVHWYAGDDAFGAAALDAAGGGMLAMDGIIPLSLGAPIDIYIYSNVNDLQSALQAGGADWAAGHVDPALGMVLVSIAPGDSQAMEMETRIPHELAHVMLYRALGAKYELQPAWLREGLAAMMEQYPNADYAYALEVAGGKNALIPFNDLCAAFPTDASSAYLAYAEAQSFVSYLRDNYGASGLSRLMSAYGDGQACEPGATSALGIPLSQLDSRWRTKALGQDVAGVVLGNLSPYLLILLLVLIVPVWGVIDTALQRRKRVRQG